MKRDYMRRFLCALLCVALVLGSLAFAESDQGYKTLYYGTRDTDADAPAVKAMQQRLKALGYETSATGGYWDKTASAVEAFQKAAGLAVNGKVATPEMQEALFASNAPKADGTTADFTAPTPEPTKVPESLTKNVLSYRMTNSEAVRQMQIRLNQLGYMTGGSSGNYWDETRKGVLAFLKAVGLPGDGYTASPTMLEKLYASDAPVASSSAPTETATVKPTETGSTGATPTPTLPPAVTATPTPTPKPTEAPVITVLTYGMENNASVKSMQIRLRELGFFNSNPTGNYWGVTASAVGAFQKAAGMAVDGKTASVTMQNLLYSDKAPSAYSSVASYNELRLNMQNNDEVRLMQRRLAALGYFDVQYVTGNYLTLTARAVAEFQKAAGLPVNGNVATTETLKALYANNAPHFGTTPAPTATPTPAPTVNPYTDIVFGQKGSAVRNMQARLKELGYLKDVVDGVYGKNTGAAVIAFQAAVHLAQNSNIATAEMQAILFSSAAPMAGATLAPTLAPGNTATPTPTPTVTPAPTAIPYQQLTYGMENNSLVKAMQDRLRELGYFSVDSTGNYYSATKKAVEAFQKACGYNVDGKTASVTMLTMLFSDKAPKFGETTTTTTPSPSSKPSDKYPDLTYGMTMHQSVLKAQMRLTELGFLAKNSSTANYDDRTVKAVEAFQTYYKYYVDGKTLTGEQQELLFTEGTKEQLLIIREGGSITQTSPDYSKADLSKILKKGSSGEQVTLLTTRLIELGYLTGSPVSYYSDAVVSAVKWFQNSNSLDPDGIAGSATLTKIYTQSVIDAIGSTQAKPDTVPTASDGTATKPSISRIQTIAWSNDAYFNRKTGVFKDGATATVTDVKTGISYKVRRRGGYNHADVDPLTAYDTWQMFRIYGEQWSWDRRAVVVTFSNGVSSAASINGMPHGESSISDNNMDGHTCIHFSGSHTHGTDNLDPAHQAAVQEAAQTSLAELQQKISSQ